MSWLSWSEVVLYTSRTGFHLNIDGQLSIIMSAPCDCASYDGSPTHEYPPRGALLLDGPVALQAPRLGREDRGNQHVLHLQYVCKILARRRRERLDRELDGGVRGALGNAGPHDRQRAQPDFRLAGLCAQAEAIVTGMFREI
jgi:hypothetical protein